MSDGLLLFDLDGTLVDSAADVAAAVDSALAGLGRPALGEATVRDYIGDGAARLLHRALTGRHDGVAPAAEFEAAYLGFTAAYAAALFRRSRVYPGATSALEALAALGWTLALVTNKPAAFTLPLLEQADLARHFDLVLAGDSCRARSPIRCRSRTPRPRFGFALARTLLVGDSVTDVAAARAAGYRSSPSATATRAASIPRAAGAACVIDSPPALPAAVGSLTTRGESACDNPRS